MKNISLEDCEATPQKLSFRFKMNDHKGSKTTTGFVRWSWEVWDHERRSESWIPRFISSYVGKSYDELYSTFLKKLDKSRIYKSGYYRDQAINHFKGYLFPNKFHRYTYSDRDETKYYVDKNNIIRKSPKIGQGKITYLSTKYVLNLKDQAEIDRFKYHFGGKFYLKSLQGISKEELDKTFYTSFNKYSTQDFMNFIQEHRGKYYYRVTQLYNKIDEQPIKGSIRTRYIAEKVKAKKKEERSKKKTDFKDLEELLHRNNKFKVSKTLAKKAARLHAKAEEFENNLIQDRLGFDSESFKTPQSFIK